MQINEYEKLDGLALAGLLEKGETTSGELMRVAIETARQRSPQLNCLTYAQYEQSQAIADGWSARGVFRGIPFLLKDSGFAARRFPSSIGSRLFDDTRYDFDATVARRFEAAGLIPFARTTVSELCMGPSTEAVRNHGPTLNPWDASRSVGGSSGGAAAAVAARLVPVAHGSDGGGSIRIPAACCGVYGLKPSRGRVPMGPSRGEGWGGMASDGVLSISVRDTAAAMDAISGYDAGAPYAAPPQPGSFLAAVQDRAVRPLRIAVLREAWNGIAIAPECRAAAEHTAGLCRALGHTVIDATLPAIDYEGFVRAHGRVLATNITLAVDHKLAASGRAPTAQDLEPVLLDGYTIGKTLSAGQYADSINRFHAIGRAFANTMAALDCDVILTPTLTQLPAKQGYLALDACGFWDFRARVSHYATFLAVINASGQPAASLPLSWTADNVPVCSQLIGRFGEEDLLLALSAQLERAEPWAHRIPDFVAASSPVSA